MKQVTAHGRLLAQPLAFGIAMAVFGGLAHAKNLTEASGLLETVGDPNESQFMKDVGLKIGGWINAGISTNFNSSPGNYNGPVTFGDRTAEPQVNQIYLYVQRAVNTEGDSWDIGGRFDFMYGTDAVFTQAYGSPSGHWDLNLTNERFYNIALPQAYAEIFAPIGNGITMKIGHFYTIIGNEVVTAPDNFFYSHAYTMQYGEPFTHTGVLLSYPVTPNITVMGGGTTASDFAGWDGAWDKGLGNWAFLGGVTWTSDDKGSSVAATATSGSISEHDNNNWSLYSLVGKHDIIEGLHYTIQHDHGWAGKIGTDGGDAEWYGVNQYLTYDIQEDLGVGIRAEWFRDDDGVRVFSPARQLGALPAASYYAITAGVNWKPLKWLTVRPNVRYDWSDKAEAFNNGGANVGYAGNRQDQVLVSTDVVLMF
ncbi:porin [Methyloterricola oryzae]|uniref:porin n=1 Tax=Methyloterricola oryzae TaxID=1495050 RepID=UPI0005EAE294|nr:porin [Methyloterricola oryzae]